MNDRIGSCGSVLLVEDEEPIRKLTTRILERAGYEVTSFDSPLEALESSVPTPNLLVIDVGLPCMSGHELADRFKEQHPDLKILLVSGAFEEGSAAATKEDRHFLQKPFSPDDLLERARACLHPA